MFGSALAAEIERRLGARVEMMHLRGGIFDDATVSVLSADTVREVCTRANVAPDARRFRPNVVVRTARGVPFEEDEWLGGVLRFGDADDAPAVAVTAPDVRCAMVNFHPDTGVSSPEVLEVAVRAHDNVAGVYATVTRVGRVAVGQRVTLHRV